MNRQGVCGLALPIVIAGLLLAGCGSLPESVGQAPGSTAHTDASPPSVTTPQAGADGADAYGGGTAKRRGSGDTPLPSEGCSPQPKTFSELSAKSLKLMRNRLSRDIVRIVKPARERPEVTPAQAAAGMAPRADCYGRRVTSWELALARISPGKGCAVQTVRCRHITADGLVYIVVRRTFGLGVHPHCCPGAPQRTQENVRVFHWALVDAHTGKGLGGGSG